MPALTGSPWRGLAKVIVDNAGLGERVFAVGVSIVDETASGDQATWEGAPGSGILLTYQTGTTGASPPGTANTITIEIRVPDGAQIGTTDWVNPADGDTKFFEFDDDPLNAVTGALRAGMFEIYIRAVRTDIVTYDVDSRGAGADANDDWAQGYLRAPVTLSAFKMNKTALADADYSGTYPSPASTFTRSTLNAVLVRSISLTYSHRNNQGGALIRTQAEAAQTTVTRDWTWSAAATGTTGNGRVNKDYPSNSIDVRLALPATSFGGDAEYVWAATGHPTGFARNDDATLEDLARYATDPRITFTQLLQLNNNAFATPPSSLNVASGQRLSSDIAFLAARATDSLGAGYADSALAWTEKLWDNGELVGSEASPVATRATTTATKGGQTGWSDGFLTWDETLPSGAWTQKQIITTSDLTGMEVTNTRTLTLLASDPRIRVFAAGGDTDNPKDHWSPGKKLVIAIAATTKAAATSVAIVADAGTVKFSLIRLNPSTGRKQYLDPTDTTGGPRGTWKDATGTTATNLFTAAVSAGDTTLSLYTFPATDTTEAYGWNDGDLAIDAYLEIGSTPHHGAGIVTALGTMNPHARNEFDPTALFK